MRHGTRRRDEPGAVRLHRQHLPLAHAPRACFRQHGGATPGSRIASRPIPPARTTTTSASRPTRAARHAASDARLRPVGAARAAGRARGLPEFDLHPRDGPRPSRDPRARSRRRERRAKLRLLMRVRAGRATTRSRIPYYGGAGRLRAGARPGGGGGRGLLDRAVAPICADHHRARPQRRQSGPSSCFVPDRSLSSSRPAPAADPAPRGGGRRSRRGRGAGGSILRLRAAARLAAVGLDLHQVARAQRIGDVDRRGRCGLHAGCGCRQRASGAPERSSHRRGDRCRLCRDRSRRNSGSRRRCRCRSGLGSARRLRRDFDRRAAIGRAA